MRLIVAYLINYQYFGIPHLIDFFVCWKILLTTFIGTLFRDHQLADVNILRYRMSNYVTVFIYIKGH